MSLPIRNNKLRYLFLCLTLSDSLDKFNVSTTVCYRSQDQIIEVSCLEN